MTKFIGSTVQLTNSLHVIANQKSCSQRNAAIVIEAADRLRAAMAALHAVNSVFEKGVFYCGSQHLAQTMQRVKDLTAQGDA